MSACYAARSAGAGYENGLRRTSRRFRSAAATTAPVTATTAASATAPVTATPVTAPTSVRSAVADSVITARIPRHPIAFRVALAAPRVAASRVTAHIRARSWVRSTALVPLLLLPAAEETSERIHPGTSCRAAYFAGCRSPQSSPAP